MLHWIVPFAGVPEPWVRGRALPAQWRLPHLQAWSSALQAATASARAVHPLPSAGPTAQDPALTLTPPHEQAFAQGLGLPASTAEADGLVPLAGIEAGMAGLDVDGCAWGRLTLAHWHLGTEQVTMRDPAELELDEAESRAFLAVLRPWFEEEGWRMEWRAPTRWLVSHPDLRDLPCASLDRVIGRNVDLWLTANPRARRIRRLQNEVQMLLHHHPLNRARESRAALAVNSFWIDGCGPAPDAARLSRLNDVRLDDRLRSAALRGDVAAWCAAFEALDRDVIGPAREAALRAEAVCLTLCGEQAGWSLSAPARPGFWRAGPVAWWSTGFTALRPEAAQARSFARLLERLQDL